MAFVNYPDGQLSLPDSLETITTYVLTEQGDWFEDDIRFLRNALHNKKNVIDVGANYGVYSICFAKQIQGEVYAFEPAAATAAYLKQSAELNKCNNLIIETKAVSDCNGNSFLTTSTNAEQNRISSTNQGEAIELVRLDDYIPAGIKIDFVKIDAEGHELNVLKGMENIINAQHPSMMFEIVNEDSNVDNEVLDFLLSHDYQLYQLVPGYNKLVSFDKNNHDPFILNAYAIYPGCALQEYTCKIQDVSTPDWEISDYFNTKPYAKNLRFNYKISEGSYLRALQHYIASQKSKGCEQIHHAFAAHKLLSEIKDQNIFYMISYLRVAYELGIRRDSNHAIMNILEKFGELLPNLIFDIPFLAISTSFENKEILSEPGLWLGASLLHVLDKKIAHSSYYSNMSSLDNLNAIKDMGYETEGTNNRTRVILERHAR